MSIHHNEAAHHSGNLSPEYALLGLLVAGPHHGYDLHQRLIFELGHVWHLSQSQTYTILGRLQKKRYIRGKLVRQHKLPDRQMLRITAAGHRHFLDWLKNGCGSNARSIRLEFLTRLYFSNLLTPGQTAQIYSTQSAEIARDVERLEDMLGSILRDQIYNRLSLDLRLRQMKVIQDWMVEIRNQFNIHLVVTQ